ncbi:SGNH/GDSL hydrolase family protein [Mariniluteicoccus flavus]
MTPPALIAVPIDPLVRGAAEVEQTDEGLRVHRLPGWARAQSADPQLAMVEAQPSGVRLALRTSATVLELDLHRTVTVFRALPARPDGVVELVVGGEVVNHSPTSAGTRVTIDLATGRPEVEPGPACTVHFAELSPDAKDVEIWLPHNESLTIVELRADAPVEPAPPSARPVWVHHGSSISHGSNATRPTGIWPVVAARLAGVDLVNLGFGGSALLDPFVARHIRDTPADVISMKVGINVVGRDVMRLRAFGPAVHGMLDTIRDGHPTTPLLVVSPLFCGIHEDTPGPGTFDPEAMARGELRFAAAGDPAAVGAGALTLKVVRDELARIVAERRATDPNLHHLDGLELYGEADAATLPLPDALHPGPETHQVVGERFAQAWLKAATMVQPSGA